MNRRVRRGAGVSLHIEWAPGWVRLVDRTTGRRGTGETIADALSKSGERSSGTSRRKALIGIGRSAVFLKSVRLPRASGDDLQRLVGMRLSQLFPLPPDQLAWDFVQTEDATADGVLTIVAAIRRQDLARLKSELDQTDLSAARILPIALASAAVAARAGHADALVEDRGASGLAFDVVQGGAVRFSRTASGDADRATEAQRTLAAAGAGALPTVAVSESDGALERLDEAPEFAFELPEERERLARRRLASRTRLAALMTLASLLLIGLIWADRSDAEAARKRSEGKWAKQLTVQRSIRDAQTKKAERARTVETQLKAAFQTAQPISDIATLVGDSLPADAWLTGLSVERGKSLQIRGTARTATQVTELMEGLGGSGRLRDVKLVFANTARIDETPVVQFSVTATAIGNLPLPTPVKASAKGAKARKATPR